MKPLLITLLLCGSAFGQMVGLGSPGPGTIHAAGGGGGGGSIALLVHAVSGTDGSTPAVSTIDSTGAALLLVVPSVYLTDATACSVVDNKGNSWHSRSNQVSTTTNSTWWYAWDHGGSPLSVGAGHTVTVTCNYPGVSVMAYSGTQTSSDPFDQESISATDACNGGTGNQNSSNALTPSVANSLVVTYFAPQNNGTAVGPSSPFTLVDRVPESGISSSNRGVNTGYVVQASPASLTATWGIASGGVACRVGEIVFKPGP